MKSSSELLQSHIPLKVLVLYFIGGITSTDGTECKLDDGRTCKFSGVITTKSSALFEPTSQYPEAVRTATVHNSTLHTLTNEICYSFPNTEVLTVTNINLEHVSKDALTDCIRLRYVFFNNNKLTYLDKDLFQANTELLGIWLESNHITLIDMTMFSPLQQLEALDISQNSLTVLDFGPLKDLPILHVITMENNFLVDLDVVRMLEKFPRLSEVSLRNNFFGCERLETVLATLNESKVKVNNNRNFPRAVRYNQDSRMDVECLRSVDYQNMLTQRLLKEIETTRDVLSLKNINLSLNHQLEKKTDLVYLYLVGGLCIIFFMVSIGLSVYLYRRKVRQGEAINSVEYYCSTSVPNYRH